MALYFVGVAVNYPWELLQSPLYAGHTGWTQPAWHCFRAALGDGILVLLVHATGALVQRDTRWYRAPTRRAAVAAACAALSLALMVEWWAVRIAGRWVYDLAMPLIPGIDIGVVPVLQMMVLPPLVFGLLRAGTAAQHREPIPPVPPEA